MDSTLWQTLVDQLERELDATQDTEDASALCCRLAIVHWDILGDRETASRWLLRADPEYVPAIEHRRQLKVDQGDAPGAAGLLEELAIDRAEDVVQARSMLVDAAMIWLYWVGDPQRVKKTCSRLGESTMDDPRLADLYEQALVAADDMETLEKWAVSPSAPLSALLRAAVMLVDRLDKPQVAAELLDRASAIDDEDPYIIELLIETSTRLSNTPERVKWMEKKYGLLSRVAPRDHEVLSLAFGLARSLVESGQWERAESLLQHVDPPLDDLNTKRTMEMEPARWAAPLMMIAWRDLASIRGDNAQLSRVYLDLAQASSLEAMRRVHRLRATQLITSRKDLNDSDLARGESLLKENLKSNPSDVHSAKALESLLLRQRRAKDLCILYEALDTYSGDLKGHLLRRAAFVAEMNLGDRALAARLLRDGLAAPREVAILGELQRLYRAMNDDLRLVDAYQREADATIDPRRRALLSCAISALHIKMDQLAEAEVAAQQAMLASANDPLAMAILTAIYSSEGKEDEVRRVLKMQVELLRAPQCRVECLHRLAAGASKLHETKDYLIQAHGIDSKDPDTLSRLMAVCEAEGEPAEAVKWGITLARIVESQPARATDVYAKIGRLHHELGEVEEAEKFLSTALSFDPGNVAALRVVAAIHRSRLELDRLLATLKRMALLLPADEGRGELLLEIGSTLVKLNAPIEEVFESFVSAAKMGAISAEAISDLEWICRQQHRLELLADFLAHLPQDVDTLFKLAEALEELGDLEALLRVRNQLVGSADSDVERADRIYEVGRVLEALRRPQEAMERYEQVVGMLSTHRQALRALGRLYKAQRRLPDLVNVLQQELSLKDGAEREIEVLMELAQIREDQGEREEAIARLEQAHALAPDDPGILERLQRLYDPDSPGDLARVLERRAEVEPDVKQKVAFLLRAGELITTLGDVDRAFNLYRKAFEHDPSNRQAFTMQEAFCFQNDRWHDLMDLYEEAIRFIENAGGRAYRPLDLYTRRGQLQLTQLSQPGEAAVSFLKALEYDPKSESVMKVLENIFVQQQDWLGLIRTYERRAELVPDNELFRLESLRQAARLATGRLPQNAPEARSLWEQIHTIDPTDEEALANLERIYTDNLLHAPLVDLLETRVVLAATDEDVIALRLRMAVLLETQLEDPIRAIKAFEGVRQINEHHEDALKALARIYEATGEWSNCLEVLRSLVIMEADPYERSLHYFRCGSIMESRFHEDEQAIGYYEAAINETSTCLPAIHGLRDLYLRRKEWEKALQTLELEVQLWDDTREEAGVLARMGEIHLHQLDDPQKAIELYSDALTIDSECIPAAVALFEMSFSRGEAGKALELSDKLASRMAKEGHPQQRSRFFCRRGQLLASNNNTAEAAESLVLALQLVPDNIEALDWLVKVCRSDADAFDFATIFRDLEQVYRREDNRCAVSHVLVAAGALAEIAGDAETAMARYQEAMEESPQELAPVSALSNLLVGLSKVNEAIIVLQKLRMRTEDPAVQIEALMHLAHLWADVVMDHGQAIRTYEEALQLDPNNQEATFLLAQEYYLQEQYEEAQGKLGSLIDRVLVEGPSRSLSSYAQYLGAVLLQLDDRTGAMQQFTIALEHDELNAGAAIGLSRILEEQGKRKKAIQLLQRTLRRAAKQPSRDQATIDLRRALAKLYLSEADIDAAVVQCQVVIEEGGRVEDRIVLAEVYAQQVGDENRAISELWRALESDGFNPHVLERLAGLYDRMGEPYRTLQVLEVMNVLGGIDRGQQDKLGLLRRQYSVKPARSIDDKLRQSLDVPTEDIYLQRIWESIKQPLEKLFPLELADASLTSVEKVSSAEFRHVVDRCINFFSMNIAVHVTRDVPGGAAADEKDGGRIVMDRLFVERPFSEVAFVLGRQMEYLRTGHALLSRLAFDDRLLLGELLVGLLQEADAQNDLVKEFCKGLSRRYIRQLEEVALEYQQELISGIQPNQPTRWFGAIDRRANQSGLVACDDIAAALRMAAQLSGQELAVGSKGEVAVQLVTDGPELVQFFLSESYLKLKRKLADFN